MAVLESEGHGKVAEYPRLVGVQCAGCNDQFQINDDFEALYDRVFGTAYLIHLQCWDQLLRRIEGVNNERDFPWEG